MSYKSLGRFVYQKRVNLGYKSADKFAEANPGLVTASYVKHIEAADGMFGSPETFTGLARALGETPGLLMDILVEFRDSDGKLIKTDNVITLPDNFTVEDKKLIADLISFIGYRKQIKPKGQGKDGRRFPEVNRGDVVADVTPNVEPPVNPQSGSDQEAENPNPTGSSK